MLDLLLQSFLIGFTAAATIGPIALLVMQRTLKHGWRMGVASGVGVALADALYGLVGALSLTAVTHLLLDNQTILRVGGGVVMVYLGVKAFTVKPARTAIAHESVPNSGSLLGAASTIFLLTLSNPMTILFFSAVYAGLGAGGEEALTSAIRESAMFFPLGVIAGSFTWWVLLASLIAALRSRFRPAQLVWINRASGLLIVGFGIWVIIRGLIP